MDALASGAFVGLRYHHTRGHLARAVMEGVSFALREAVNLSLSLGAQAHELVMAGGGAQSKVWRQILTDVLGVPLKRSQQSEQASLGAAILAGVGVGVYPDVATACASITAYDAPTTPHADAKQRYDELFATYQSLYPTLKDTMHTLQA
jgi:xylulokinase